MIIPGLPFKSHCMHLSVLERKIPDGLDRPDHFRYCITRDRAFNNSMMSLPVEGQVLQRTTGVESIQLDGPDRPDVKLVLYALMNAYRRTK